MDPRERWQALQARLTAARTALERGERARALAEVSAALAIDPSFLAAVSLRERILAGEPIVAAAAAPATESTGVESRSPKPESRPLVSADGYARFEQRARRRRVDRKIEAARAAIARGRLREAAAALDEVIELDPNLPDLAQLTAAFDNLRRGRGRRRVGPALVAASVFAAMLFRVTWLRERHPLASRPAPAIGGLAEAIEPAALDVEPADEVSQPIATSGDATAELAARAPAPRVVEAAAEPPAKLAPTPRIAAERPSIVPTRPAPPSELTPTPAPLSGLTVQQSRVVVPPPAAMPAPTPPPSTVVVGPPVAAATFAANVPKPAAASPVPTAELDHAQIQLALQRYRTAYEGLDARQARAVWPAVNEAALARAFDSLQSQTLTFDVCDVMLNGDDARATCRGTARYVPKIGSREPHVEPRSWTFALRKTGTEWKIESARAER